MMEDVPRLPGTYVLILHLEEAQWVQVGRLGEFHIPPGWLAYVGSARGPGGLLARLARHLRHPKPQRWHIDFLRPVIQPDAIWWATGTERRECLWAAALARMPGASCPVPGFGSSDCRCRAHLFHFPEPPDRERFARLTGEEGLTEILPGRKRPGSECKAPRDQEAPSGRGPDGLPESLRRGVRI